MPDHPPGPQRPSDGEPAASSRNPRALDTPQPSRRPVGIKQVAARAGVSWKTVSNVVNGTARVRPETRTRVEAAITELGYRPNQASRQLRRGTSTTLLLAVPELVTPYFGSLADAVLTACDVRGYTTLIEITRGTTAGEEAALREAAHHAVAGILLSPVAISTETLLATHDGRPLVLLGEHLYGTGLPHVAIDNEGAASELATHLLVRGRRRFAFLGGRRSHGTPALRFRGLRAAVVEAGGELPDAAFVETPGFSSGHGYDAANRLINSGYRPDAVVCGNDAVALGALQAFREAGLDVPNDIAVAGFDDDPASAYSHPPLTSVAPDLACLAEMAVAQVVSTPTGSALPDLSSLRAEHVGINVLTPSHPGRGVTEALAPHRIVVRESTARSILTL